MVKSYLRYEHDAVFGLVASSTCNAIAFGATSSSTSSSSPPSTLVTAALERVLLWDTRRGVMLQASAMLCCEVRCMT